MSIYLGSSEPSKIYVGSNEVSAVYVEDEKVRPSVLYEFSYKFVGKSSSLIQADGWSIVSGTPYFDTNGISGNSSVNISYNIGNSVFANAKKITISYNFSLNSMSSTLFGVAKSVSSSTVGLTGTYNSSGSSVTQIQIYGTILKELSPVGSGTYTHTYVIDLANKMYSLSGTNTRSGTLTDAQVSNMRDNLAMMRVSCVYHGGTGVKDISLKVE